MCIFVRLGFADKPRGSFEKMAENVVDPLMQPEIILTENDVPGVKLTKDLAECNVDELKNKNSMKRTKLLWKKSRITISSSSGRFVKTKH